MSIRRGAFGRSRMGAFIESRLGARGWPANFPILLTGRTTGGGTPSGIGLRGYADEYDPALLPGDPGYGDKLVEGWQNQSERISGSPNYDDTHNVFSFTIGPVEKPRIRLTDREGNTIWTYTVTDALSSATPLSVVLVGDKVFFSFVNAANTTFLYRAIDRETGTTVLWTVDIGSLGVGTNWHYVDANQDTYFIRSGSDATTTYIKLAKLNSSGTLVSDVTVASLPLAMFASYSVIPRLTRVGSDFLISVGLVIAAPHPALPVFTYYIFRITKTGSVVWQNDHTAAFPGGSALMQVVGGKIIGMSSGFGVNWFDASDGTYIDSMNTFTGTSLEFGQGVCLTDKSNELYVFGSTSGFSNGKVIRINITSKTVVWQQVITTGSFAIILGMATRPWPG